MEQNSFGHLSRIEREHHKPCQYPARKTKQYLQIVLKVFQIAVEMSTGCSQLERQMEFILIYLG
jgi:hypothetical protein